MPRVEKIRHSRATQVRTRQTRFWRSVSLVAALFVIMVIQPGAQSRPVNRLAEDPVAAMVPSQIELLVGRSTVLTLDQPIRRVSLSTPEIADALVTSPRQVLIHGKAPGTISLLVWGRNEEIWNYDVVVRRDLSPLNERLAQLFPNEQIDVASNGTDIVISGTVETKYVVDKAAAVAAGYVETAENVVNLLRQQEGVASTQIMLRVRFAEVSRSALQELGASVFTGMSGSGDWVGRTTTQQFPAPNLNDPDESAFDQGLVFSDFLNLFAFNTEQNIGVLVKALENKGLFQSLAEPNLITQNGKEATFLAGGEYPYPVVQGSSQNGAVTIIFKEFGVRLRFTPTIVGDDLINLQVAPEVSALDFSNSIILEGFRIPALSTRRTETEVELRDGQTFAIAGLLDNTLTESMSKVPGLGDIPVLGYLFRSRAYQKNQTELVVMITPHIMRRESNGVTTTLPGFPQPFMEEEPVLLPAPPPYPQGTSMWKQPGSDVLAGNEDIATGSEEGPLDSAVGAAAATSGAGTTVIETKADRRRIEEERRITEKERAEAEKLSREEAKEAEKLARAEAKREAEEAERLAKAERKRLEEERKVAEEERKVAEKLAREEAKEAEKLAREEAKEAEKLARAEAKREAEGAERLAKAERKRLEEERKVAEEERKVAEKLARGQAEKLAARTGQAARRKAEAKRIDEERKQAAQDMKQAEKVARASQKRASELEEEREARQEKLEQILAEYLTKIDEAQRAVDEVDDERSDLVIPLDSRQREVSTR